MFGIGPQEMGVIALIALIIFGPGKLPEVMREAGAQYKKFKGLADEMTGELNKVTAEARKELDGAFGDLGPEMEKSLGLGSGKKTTTTANRATTTGTKKSTTTSSSTAKKTTTSTSTSSAKKSTTSGTTASKTSSSATPSATKTSTKPVVATKEDPLADFAGFQSETRQTKTRKRSAAPSAITDLTPRQTASELVAEITAEPVAVDLAQIDDPIERARARRRTAGYART
ncbi:MAG: twin-arginine translocase TatA/TatE family subunit [Thermomicrobiales bacterium]|nr:twin-arginine translocase TatA/TatE family subunit [Thermomicrobiales bacterium]